MPTRLDANPDQTSPRRRLLFFTSLSALDGTVVTMAAIGGLSTLMGAVVCGLLVVAGTGAWLSARDAFASRMSALEWRRFAGIAAVSGVLTLLAAVIGSLGATVIDPVWLPRAAGVVMVLLGAEVAGFRVPGLPGLRMPMVVLAAGSFLEVATRWTP